MARNNDFLREGVVGSAPSYVTVTEKGDKYNRVTILEFDTAFPAIAGGASLAVGKLLYTLPAGACIIEASRLNVAIFGGENIDEDTPDIGLGTTIASGAVAVLGGTAAFENILTGQTMTDCDGTATDAAVDTNLLISAAGDHTVYLNVADGWAASGDASADVRGKVVLHWRYLGD
jgi:hypothetical protein